MAKYLLIIAVLAFYSCSNSNTKITSEDNFEVVEFPDGSIAYLNKNSSIEYDQTFDQRFVKQNGEAFFIITKGDSPFVVKTKSGEIKVLGTEFNVKSNGEELEVEVEEGSVELKTEGFFNKIKKGQKALFKENKDGINFGRADFKHKKWINDLNKEFKKLGKEIRKGSKQFEKESKKLEKEVNKELKKLNLK